MKTLTKFLAIFIASIAMLACGNNTETVDEAASVENASVEEATVEEETAVAEKADGNTLVAKFVDATSMEGEEWYTFEKEDGTKIEFHRVVGNAEVTEEPLEYPFFDYENLVVNDELIGTSFEINYRVSSDCYDEDGGKIDCNKINTIKKVD